MSWRDRLNGALWRHLGKPLFIRDAFQFQILLCGTQGLWPELFRSAANNVTASYDRFRRRRENGVGERGDLPPEPDLIRERVARGRLWLEGLQDSRGAIVARAKWNTWDTANAVLALQEAGSARDVVERSLSFLFSYQDPRGAVPCRTDHYGRLYCIETTSMSLLAEFNQKGGVTPEVSRGIDFLLSAQAPNGGWEEPFLGIPREEVQVRVNYYPSNIGFALVPILLFADKRIPEKSLTRALTYLEVTREADASWGTALSYCSVEGYATKNIVPALRLVASRRKELATRADSVVSGVERFARRSQNEDGSWSSSGPSSRDLATTLMARSLPMRRDDPAILEAVWWLLRRQRPDGRWDGGWLGGESLDVLATAETITLLSEFEDSLRTGSNETSDREGVTRSSTKSASGAA